jgi:hypothetical protein
METWAPANVFPIEWEFHSQVACEPTASCLAGQYMNVDCSCSTNPCDACPPGTLCQNQPGYPLLCLDCTCGACDADNNSCCDFNERNNCKANSKASNTECNLQNGWFSCKFKTWGDEGHDCLLFLCIFLPTIPLFLQFLAIDGTGNTCSGVEISLHATPNGCGCQPSETEPCTYNPAERSLDDWCYVCNADELVRGNTSGSDPCDVCKACLSNCHSCVEGASSTAGMMTCLASDAMNTGNSDPECRENCSNVCTKIQI